MKKFFTFIKPSKTTTDTTTSNQWWNTITPHNPNITTSIPFVSQTTTQDPKDLYLETKIEELNIQVLELTQMIKAMKKEIRKLKNANNSRQVSTNPA